MKRAASTCSKEPQSKRRHIQDATTALPEEYKRSFFHAAFYGHTHIITGLLKNLKHRAWALMCARNDNNYTALHIAAENGQVNVVSELIQAAGRNTHELIALTANKKTAIDLASGNGHYDIVQILEQYQYQPTSDFECGSFESSRYSQKDIHSKKKSHTPFRQLTNVTNNMIIEDDYF